MARPRPARVGHEGVHEHERQRGGGGHRQPAQARHRLRMNLPAARGVYQLKQRRGPSNHGGQEQRQRGATETK